jgi:hypothetical protein
MSSKKASDKRAYPPPYDSLAALFPESGFLLAYREQLRRTLPDRCDPEPRSLAGRRNVQKNAP